MDLLLRPVWAEINIDNIIHNIKEVRRVTSSHCQVMAVIKADGYGHGALGIYKHLLENGADRLAVAVSTEALQLRKDGYNGTLMILGYTQPSYYPLVIEKGIIQSIYTLEQAKELSSIAQRRKKKAIIHLKIDTGMGRIGILPNEEGINIVKAIAALPYIEVEGIFTHLAVADEKDKGYTYRQYERFNNFFNRLRQDNIEIKYRHISNSAAIIDLPELNLDIVRPGIMIYGLYPSYDVDKSKVVLKEAMSLKAKIAHVKTLPVGESVSYGRRFIATRESIIATLPLGYADGFTRLLSKKAEVLIKGVRAPIIGSICMDQCMVDITDIPEVKVGDEAVLFGQQGDQQISIDEVAAKLGTINYEIVCMIGKRVPRVYIKDGSMLDIKDYIYDIHE